METRMTLSLARILESKRQHCRALAALLMFVRTLRKAVMQKASVASLRQPPFTAIGDPEKLFPPAVLRDMLDLTLQLAA
jgi:hypothetical protein